MEGNPQKGLLGTGSEAEGSHGGNLAAIDDNISMSPADITKAQQGLLTNALPGNIIQNVPVEILAIIFGFVHEAIFAPTEVERYLDVVAPQPEYRQPSQSPPLLVGAVCKDWRDITLTMPRLWTNLTINLFKSPDGQLAMTNAWAARSSRHPLNITISVFPHSDLEPEDFETLFSALRSLATRWNDVALLISGPFRQMLLTNLEGDPPIGSLYLPRFGHIDDDFPFIPLRHPLRPRRFVSSIPPGIDLRCNWDRLVILEVEFAEFGEILHIIRHAQNLTHCIAEERDLFEHGHFPLIDSPIINRSLVYLRTACEIIGYLTLPSLIHLDYSPPGNFDEYSDIFDFMDCSCPPLDDFILGCCLDPLDLDTLPPFDRLPGLTSLSLSFRGINGADHFVKPLTQLIADPALLPRLKTLSLTFCHLSESSWALFGDLFSHYAQQYAQDNMPPDATPVRRPLPGIAISLASDAKVIMDKETFLRLSEAKKQGVLSIIVSGTRKDVLRGLAERYDVGK